RSSDLARTAQRFPAAGRHNKAQDAAAALWVQKGFKCHLTLAGVAKSGSGRCGAHRPPFHPASIDHSACGNIRETESVVKQKAAEDVYRGCADLSGVFVNPGNV